MSSAMRIDTISLDGDGNQDSNYGFSGLLAHIKITPTNPTGAPLFTFTDSDGRELKADVDGSAQTTVYPVDENGSKFFMNGQTINVALSGSTGGTYDVEVVWLAL